MSDSRSTFDEVLITRLIPEFCSDPKRCCDVSGFRRASVRVSERDGRYFLMALDAGLIEHQGRGVYRTANSAAGEQFFWEGPRAQQPRDFSLWMEPVITIAALARLHFDYGWPRQLIGTQSVDWAFDVVAFLPNQPNEFVAGEVKKTAAELNQLVGLMEEFGRRPEAAAPVAPAKARNAFKKVAALRARRAPVFWAVGPDGLSRVFRVRYPAQDEVRLVPADDEELGFPRASK